MDKMTAKDLYERFAGKRCKRFPKDAKQKELKEAHRIKMEIKEHLRNKIHPESTPHILANQSVHSEYYGETPAEQYKRMAEKSS